MPDSLGRLRIREAAALLGVHENTVRNLISAQKLTAVGLPGGSGYKRIINDAKLHYELARRGRLTA